MQQQPLEPRTILCVCVYLSAGYANEVGEAFRALVPVSLVWGSYAVATAYVTADAVDKGKKAAVVRHIFATKIFFSFRFLISRNFTIPFFPHYKALVKGLHFLKKTALRPVFQCV